MDYDHPHRERRKAFKPFHVACLAMAVCGLLWLAVEVLQFAVLRLRSKSEPGVVVGYERAGGHERLRVQVTPGGKPGGFVLLNPANTGPRYETGQPVEVLTWTSTNRFGQQVQENAAYSPLNYWQKHLVVALVVLVTGLIGALGLRRKRSSSGASTTEPPLCDL
jgi:hypothetical protein